MERKIKRYKTLLFYYFLGDGEKQFVVGKTPGEAPDPIKVSWGPKTAKTALMSKTRKPVEVNVENLQITGTKRWRRK